MSWIGIGVGTLALGTVGNLAMGARAQKQQNKLAQGASQAFQPLEVPEPAEIDYMDPEEILSRWRGEVWGNREEYSKIGGFLNEDEQKAAQRANLMANPQYYGLLDNMTSKALDYSKGNLPDDVQDNILKQASESAYLRGFSYGTEGKGGNVYANGNDAAANLALKNLGLTSLDLSKFGLELTGQALDQSRASRGQIISAKDTIPTQAFFQDQLNKQSEGMYMNEQNQNNFEAASANAPAQAAYNQLLFQSNQAVNQQQLQMQQLSNITGLVLGGANIFGNLHLQSQLSQRTGAPGAAAASGSLGAPVARTAGSWVPGTTLHL